MEIAPIHLGIYNDAPIDSLIRLYLNLSKK